jgi:hypothetical protein
MSYSYTFSESQTFTVTHARHIASKVATDLKRIQRFYGNPSDYMIEKYEAEIIEYLKNGYLGSVTYGFKKSGNWIEPTLKYTSKELAGLNANDDDPGRIRANANIEGAGFYSYLTYSSIWDSLTKTEQDNFQRTLPIQRIGAEEPGISGYLSNDKTYSSGGRALDRSIIKSY